MYWQLIVTQQALYKFIKGSLKVYLQSKSIYFYFLFVGKYCIFAVTVGVCFDIVHYLSKSDLLRNFYYI